MEIIIFASNIPIFVIVLSLLDIYIAYSVTIILHTYRIQLESIT